jgi:hypothetical protein
MTILAIDLTANRTRQVASVPIPETGNADERARTMLAETDIKHWLERIYNDHARDPYYRDRSDQPGEHVLADTLRACLRGDRDDANAVLSNVFPNPYDQVDDMLVDIRLASIITAIAEHLEIETDVVEQMCRGTIESKIDDENYGEPLEYLRPWDKIEIAILPALTPGLSIEDERIESWRHGDLHPTTVIPNVAFARTLCTLNISSADYIRSVKSRYGCDLRRPVDHASVRPISDDDRERAGMWRRLRVRSRRTQPTFMTMDELFEVLENASLGGQLAIAAKAPVADLIMADWSNGVQLRGTVQIGIVDYLWGSGHSVSHTGGILLRDRERLYVARDLGHRFDDVCGLTSEYFNVERVTSTSVPVGRRKPPIVERTA